MLDIVEQPATITGMTNALTPEQAHDETMLALMLAATKAETKFGYAESHLRSESRPHGRYVRDDRRTMDEVFADLEIRRQEGVARYPLDDDDDRRMVAYVNSEFDKVVAAHKDAGIALADAYLALRVHERNYTGWQRYFLVTSSAGLVHSSMTCSSCNKGRSATTFALLPSLSGRNHEALVEALGPSLCSVCWPDAPVAWTDEQRISPVVANVLFEQGEAAFWTALADSRAKAAKRAASKAANAAALAARRAARNS